MPKRHRALLAALRRLALAGLLLPAAGSAYAAELTGFISGATPGAKWGTGYGGMLTISLFNIVGAEIEGAWQGADAAIAEGSRYSYVSLSGKAYVGPPIGRLVPYAGLGAGVYRLSFPGGSDNGTLGSVFVGAKLKFPLGLVVRGEYQWLNLPQPAPVQLDQRYFVGLGLSF
jgi:hypothetical protein